MADLRKFRDKLGSLRLFDPACGCGNFLIIAYRELRTLEIDVLREIASRATATQLALAVQSVVEVDQFYGIEIGEFPARIASTALWMMDHIMNNRLSLEFGQTYARIPIEKSLHIRNANALEVDWADVLPPDECSYVFGNPPFGGAKFQSPEQRAQVRRVAALGGSGGTLDYVTPWFIRAGDYVQQAQSAGKAPPRIGFVATNSITQGEQVAQLWPLLLDHRRLEIAFAHRTFAWGSDARGKAHVHVVIIGLDAADHAPRDRRLFAYEDINGEPLEGRHAVITPYLFDGGALTNPHAVVWEESRPLNGMPRLIIGSKPIDGGHYILDAATRAELLAACPEVAPFVRPYVGSWEYLNGGERYILCLHDAPPELLRREPVLGQRVAAVRELRQRSKSAPTRCSTWATRVLAMWPVRGCVQWTRCQGRTISVGTSISLRVAGTDIDWAKNGPGENHGPLFQDNDLTRLRSEQLYYDRVDPNDSDLAREEIAFAKQLSGLVPRLELLGFTLKQVEAEYSQTTQEHAEKAETLDEESERSSPRLMTFPEFCAFVSSYPIGELDDTFVGSMDDDATRRREGRFFGEGLKQRIPRDWNYGSNQLPPPEGAV